MKDFCNKIGGELSNDLYQEIFLILLEKSDEWIIEKYNSGYWEGLIYRIALNQFRGNRTRFEKLYHTPIGMFDVDESIPDNQSAEIKEYLHQSIEDVVGNYEWYETKIFELYCNGKAEWNIKPRSARSISRATGISRQEILKVVNEIKQKANERFIDNYSDSIDGIDFC